MGPSDGLCLVLDLLSEFGETGLGRGDSGTCLLHCPLKFFSLEQQLLLPVRDFRGLMVNGASERLYRKDPARGFSEDLSRARKRVGCHPPLAPGH